MAYSTPHITDHGTLVQLTADFDAAFVGSVAKVVTMAAVSAPVIGGGDGATAGVLEQSPTSGANPASDTGDSGTLGQTESGGGGLADASDDGGGRLPFTGFAAMAVAAVGAALTSAGIATRAALRRRS